MIDLEVKDFFLKFSSSFEISKYSFQEHALDYFKSLFKLEKKKVNCQNIADYISPLNNQSINHFLNSTRWSSSNLIDEIARESSFLLKKNNKPTALLLDEVSFRKKGNMSACVSRQYLGCIGKVDNGQVAVMSGLSQGGYYTPINSELFMPEEWENDLYRRKKCKIPEVQKHVSKTEIALNLIDDAIKKDIGFDFVNFDALYGNSNKLLEELVDRKINFIGDIRSNHLIYFENHKSEKTSVAQYVSSLSSSDFQKINIRNSTKGKLKARFHYVKVQVLTEENRFLELILLIRRDPDGKTKYSLSNMENDHIKELAEKQGQRIFVEQIFKEGKNIVGMGDYQVRSWQGFNNHIALCLLAMLLILKIKLENIECNYTSYTIREIICLCIKTKIESPELALETILKRHYRYKEQLERDRNIR